MVKAQVHGAAVGSDGILEPLEGTGAWQGAWTLPGGQHRGRKRDPREPLSCGAPAAPGDEWQWPPQRARAERLGGCPAGRASAAHSRQDLRGGRPWGSRQAPLPAKPGRPPRGGGEATVNGGFCFLGGGSRTESGSASVKGVGGAVGQKVTAELSPLMA